MNNPATLQEEREFAFSDKEFHFLRDLVNRQTGIKLADHKRDMVYSRLVRRLRALKLPSFAAYCTLLQSAEGEAELGNFVNALTTNLTSFFREAHHFEHLSQQVLRPLQHQAEQHKKFRIWSAACSAGMEPYSIAMTVQRSLPNLAGWDVKILATDIDTNMLQKAAQGVYSQDDWLKVPAAYQDMAIHHEHQVHMPDSLKSMIHFKHLNLLEPWPMRGLFDVVFCRNVVIYFDKPTQKELFDRMADRMKPGGWLYIGHSENLMHVSKRFELCGRTIYRRVA